VIGVPEMYGPGVHPIPEKGERSRNVRTRYTAVFPPLYTIQKPMCVFFGKGQLRAEPRESSRRGEGEERTRRGRRASARHVHACEQAERTNMTFWVLAGVY
jgi:hypothetical protein